MIVKLWTSHYVVVVNGFTLTLISVFITLQLAVLKLGYYVV